ncbi:Myb-like DNA-binding domain containing protein [Trichomonas vaginalis G3]|uniref:Myb-like DNA-binding domain containing protein n=1 Tax=Trichomonas vaginalis (strain ATCC PRA-98 / G3) TaxID=412133 RepID=A2DA77_TRIV3|nr:RNA polymerase II transcription regulator recruiting protein [Trichomonas vaginalis G3]EAY22725.1 Myb-like DNA-binding domain containing protein [Trichomonas vaginalis G3]KAI5525536.1 RNA polymerase II transcription regulator recruiting protein [Trichomonas vaginalis G3]|eukprot:XP_001583711.1 Myb-like DNA-binding domain containing protein [Trichomonas vaginalis G3]
MQVRDKSEQKEISPRSLPKQKFTDEDDQKLRNVIKELGTKNWSDIAAAMGNRNARQCKERWENYLSPSINNTPFTPEEDALLLEKQKEIGSKWVTMKNYFDRRTDAALKNRWQMLIRKQKKLQNISMKKSAANKRRMPKFEFPTPINIESPNTKQTPINIEIVFQDIDQDSPSILGPDCSEFSVQSLAPDMLFTIDL